MDSKNMIKIAGQGIGLLISQLKANTGVDNQPIFVDPLCTAIKLAIIANKPADTKCSFHDNIIYIEEPFKFQGLYRMFTGAERDQLHHLRAPLLYFKGLELGHITCENNNIDIEDLSFIRSYVIKGIHKLQHTYKNKGGSSVNDCLNDYIEILSSEYSKEDYEKKLEILNKPTLFVIYNEFIKKWQNADMKHIIASFKFLEMKSDDAIKNTIADSIDKLVMAKDMEINIVR